MNFLRLAKNCLPAVLPALALAATIAGARGQENATDAKPAAAPKLDLKAFPGALVDKVVVPVPAEIFAVLDKFGQPDWSGQIQLPERNPVSAGRVRLALVFGSTVAEGFIAVQAERGESIQDVGRRVLRLSESLGLGDAVVPHCQSIIDAAGEKEWRRVREELDRTQQTVRTTMEKLRDDDLANLVSLGGWLRGTEAVTAIVSGTYSPDKAELLNQPDIVRHFRDEIAAMNQLVRSEPEVVAIAEGLSVILGEIEKAEGAAPSADAVLRIGETCRTLLEGFYFEKPKPAPTGSNSQP